MYLFGSCYYGDLSLHLQESSGQETNQDEIPERDFFKFTTIS